MVRSGSLDFCQVGRFESVLSTYNVSTSQSSQTTALYYGTHTTTDAAVGSSWTPSSGGVITLTSTAIEITQYHAINIILEG